MTTDHNVFAGAFVDRIGERRKDGEWLENAAASPRIPGTFSVPPPGMYGEPMAKSACGLASRAESRSRMLDGW